MRVATIPVTTHGRYLVGGTHSPRLLLGFHGYGESADDHFARLEAIQGSADWTRVAIQGLHRFYTPSGTYVVASWMTRQDRELAMADNTAYVAKVTQEVLGGRQPDVLVCAGFSQGVAMAFRTALSLPAAARHVIAVGGDVPPELDRARLSPLASVLICRGAEDKYYGSETFDKDLARLTGAGVRVEPRLLGGKHSWPAEMSAIAGAFLKRSAGL